MVTSGTGHPGARLLARAHQAPGRHRQVATKKLAKPLLEIADVGIACILDLGFRLALR